MNRKGWAGPTGTRNRLNRTNDLPDNPTPGASIFSSIKGQQGAHMTDSTWQGRGEAQVSRLQPAPRGVPSVSAPEGQRDCGQRLAAWVQAPAPPPLSRATAERRVSLSVGGSGNCLHFRGQPGHRSRLAQSVRCGAGQSKVHTSRRCTSWPLPRATALEMGSLANRHQAHDVEVQ